MKFDIMLGKDYQGVMTIFIRYISCLPGLIIFLILGGCMAPSHRADVETSGNLTVGTEKKNIKKGMSGAEVASALGSPNIVTTDAQMRETWIYDKISSEVVRSESAAGIPFLTIGASGARSKSQKALTVIIKFDEGSRVREFAYHTSRF